MLAIAAGLLWYSTNRKENPAPEAPSKIEDKAPAVVPSQTSTPKPSVNADGWYTTKGGHIATLTEADLEKVMRLAVSKDDVALQKMIDGGRAIVLKKGVQVHLEKCLGMICSTVEVRPKGMEESVFTVKEAIE